jgi:hypothetical protein
MTLKILVCGSRDVEPISLLRRILCGVPKDSIIIHGAARGVDSTAGMVARWLGLKVEEYPADWKRDGKMAGPIRNQLMLDQNPDIVIAVHDDPLLGRGTRDMVDRANRKRVPTFIFLTGAADSGI